MQRSFSRRLVSAALALSLCGVAASAQAQGGEDAAKLTTANALYEEATKAMTTKDYATACPKLEEVVKLLPQGVGGRYTLAQCYEGAGKLASAYTNYSLAESMAAAAKRGDVQTKAHEGAAKLKPKLAKLTISVADGVRSLAGFELRRDGVPVGAAQWGVAIPVDKGPHVVAATAAGKRGWEKAVEVSSDGGSATVVVDALVDANVGAVAPPVVGPPAVVPPPVVPPPMAPAVVVPARQAGQRADAPVPAPKSLSHRGQFGAVLRADIDGQGAGVVPAPGLSYGIGDYFEVAACGLVGRNKGVEPGVTVLLLRGAWKPLISVGAPIFFVDGVRPGARASVGVEWDPIRYLGVFVEAGVAVFPNAASGLDKVVFVPSVGVQPRL